MPFSKLGLTIGRGIFNSKVSVTNLTTHVYKSELDTFAEMTASSYFPDDLGQSDDMVQVGDLMQLQDLNKEERMYVISVLSPLSLTQDSGNLQEEKLTHETAFGGVYAAPVFAALELSKIGTQVICGFPPVVGTAISPVVISETVPIPSNFAPSTSVGIADYIFQVVDSGVEKDGFIEVLANGSMNIYSSSALATFTGSGATGFNSFYMSWITD